MNFEGILADPPRIAEHHVRLPEQAANLLGAGHLHKRGYTGRGLKVAIIDSGFFRHPFYAARDYRIRYVPTPREKDPHIDEYGHGTAQLASLFALAPRVEALAIKCMDKDPSVALEKALELKPHVISCAWGFNIDPVEKRKVPRAFRRMQGLILEAVRQGITVVAAGGNGQRAFPASMPEVIAAGGVFYSPQGDFTLSDVSSRFESGFFPGRVVPDICGLVGNRPHGRLLLVPVPPQARLARRPAFAAIAAGESNGVQNGWAMFSGTSAATAMISGACAVLLQKNKKLTPTQIKGLLVESSKLVEGERLLDLGKAFQLLEAGAF